MYNTQTLSNQTSETIRKCNQCGNDLILQKSSTSKGENSFSPMVQNTYRCSNKACQDEIDKKILKQIELKNEQALAKQRRLASAGK